MVKAKSSGLLRPKWEQGKLLQFFKKTLKTTYIFQTLGLFSSGQKITIHFPRAKGSDKTLKMNRLLI
jgi:hypothetical protein